MTVTPTVKSLLTPEQAAEYLGMSRKTLDRMLSRGEGPAFYDLAGTRRYDTPDLDAWVRSTRREPSAS